MLIGVGGLATCAVQIARATTAAQVIAVDVKTRGAGAGPQGGGHTTRWHRMTMPPRRFELTGGRGADVLIDFVGAAPTIELARTASATRPT